MKTVRPPKLSKGDLIGLVSPASPVADPSRIEKAVRYFESHGYRTLVGKSVGMVHGYLAGKDRDRVRDLHAMFSNKRVRAIIALRGGYGTPRLLSHLDYDLIGRNPKILCGFSDMTALQLALWKKCRLVTFHGPMAAVDFANDIEPFTEEMFWRCVTSPKKLGTISFPEEPRVHSLNEGMAKGRLLGGNLSLIISVLGTPAQPRFKNSLLFIEEVTEEPYRVDRMLTQLKNSGALSDASGLLFGQFTDCNPIDPSKPTLTIDQILSDVAADVKKPILSNLSFGHVSKKMTLPVGLLAQAYAKKCTLEFQEPAVQ